MPAYLSEMPADNGGRERGAIHHALVESLGNYCSYCEMPLSGYHIEHLRLLAEWPEFLTVGQWDDLLLICNDCRCNIRVPVLNEIAADAMLWPDRDITFSLMNSPLKYELRKVNYVVVDEGERVLEEVRELVFVVANPDAGDELFEKAYNTIVHFQLNMKLEYYDAATNELRIPLGIHRQRADNRVFKRTKAWFDALHAVKLLRDLENIKDPVSADPAVLRRVFIDQVAMTAWYSGNWSVWMTVFYEQTRDIELLRTAFAGNIHVFQGLNSDNDALFRVE